MMGEASSKSVNLAYQGLDEVPSKILKRYGSEAVELDLSHNNVHDFRFLTEMPKLESLILDHNGLDSQLKFPTLPSLKTLWVNHNYIENLSYFIATLSECFPNLRILSMMNNDAAPSYFNGGSYVQYQDYRHFVISQLPNLEFLDDTPVSTNERSEAERIYPKISLKNNNYKRAKQRKSCTKTSHEEVPTEKENN